MHFASNFIKEITSCIWDLKTPLAGLPAVLQYSEVRRQPCLTRKSPRVSRHTGMTVISWDTCDSLFSSRGPSRSPPTYRGRTDDYKERARLNLELRANRRKIKIKGRVKILVRSQILRLMWPRITSVATTHTYILSAPTSIVKHHFYLTVAADSPISSLLCLMLPSWYWFRCIIWSINYAGHLLFNFYSLIFKFLGDFIF